MRGERPEQRNPQDDSTRGDRSNTSEETAPAQPEKASEKVAEKAEDQGKPSEDEELTEDSAKNPAKRLELDPFGKLLGVQRAYRRSQGQCRAANLRACSALEIKLPTVDYPLRLAPSYMVLADQEQGQLSEFVLADKDAEAVRIYQLGKGQVVTLAENYFDNRDLPRLDHAQLLLYLTQLGIEDKRTMFVHYLDFLPWYEALWENAKYALLSLALALLLLLWMVVRRFGPLLPEAILERRSMIEHIDASGRWLWHLPGGPEVLLSAARKNTQQVLRRRIAEWGRLSPQEQVERLQQDGQFTAQKLWQALHEKPSANPLQFTTQVQTLQTLRRHYERK